MSQAERTIGDYGQETKDAFQDDMKEHYGDDPKLAGESLEETELFKSKKDLDLAKLLGDLRAKRSFQNSAGKICLPFSST